MSWAHVPARTRARVRAAIAATLPRPCSVCALPVHPGQPWDVDHLQPTSTAPALILEPANLAPAHRVCNQARGNRTLAVTAFTWPASAGRHPLEPK